MGGAILLLFLGTQILNWYWLALLVAVSVGFGTYRTVRRIPGHYQLAQMVDRRMALHDALSTAFFFSKNSRRAAEPIVEAQREIAERLLRETDIRTAVPYAFPRRLYAVGALAIVAFAMIGVRYGVRHSLDLRPPLVPAVLNLFQSQPPLLAAEKKTEQQKRLEDEWKKMGISLDDPAGEKDRASDQAPDSAYSNIDTPNVDNSAAQNPNGKDKNGKQSEESATEEGEGNEKSEGASEASGEAGKEDRSSAEQANSAKGNQANSQGKPSSKQAGENSSLMDKMRDAMANLLAKLKMQPPKSGEGQQQASNQQGGAQNGRQQQQMGQRGQKAGRQQEGQPNGEQQGDQEGEGAERSQTAQGRGGERGSDRQAPQDARSGIGKNDGSKDLREAEQLAAMGKISEIIGKRSQNVTGEVMVEVASGKQQLKTPYSQRRSVHGDSGGEINRDEVPLEFQRFVQQYFEEIHKTPPAGTRPAPVRDHQGADAAARRDHPAK